MSTGATWTGDEPRQAPDPAAEAEPPEWELCGELVAARLVQVITLISGGVADYHADDFDTALPDVPAAAEGLDRLRANCASAARLVSIFADTQEARLAEMGTGRLIRVVLHAEHGAIFCYQIVPGQYVVAFAFLDDAAAHTDPLTEHAAVNRVDREITTLVRGLRDRLGLPDQNPGGWAAPPSLPPQSGLAESVRHGDLHLVARVRQGRDTEGHDCFDLPTMRQYLKVIDAGRRRAFYAEFAEAMFATVGQVGRLVRATVAGHLRRVVLDVEQGAVYYYRLGVGDYLTGVTLNQSEVSAADARLARLADELPS
ncbi:hypothetical protein [Actinokineospora enzanensis]|uniref:hypothetical protein n=1 Tax=Actinokineospora enzanensis TaxID=155975 RepID=UPI000361B83B|nr:hypothetical protein [Actinokineospora enzanensis]